MKGASSTIRGRNLLTSDHLKQGQWQCELVSCQRFYPCSGRAAWRKGLVSMLTYRMVSQLVVPVLMGRFYDIFLLRELDELHHLESQETALSIARAV